VDNFLRWTDDFKIKIMRPNELHEHGAVLHDLGMEPMLQTFRKEYIEPITRGDFLFFLMRMNQKTMSEMRLRWVI